ncbi:hypothetical protein M0802_001991 [Mischocyttarus mexicanus]|nr:hypothetical protein M0802_001991 [Mischocyttarus mexicanus]
MWIDKFYKNGDSSEIKFLEYKLNNMDKRYPGSMKFIPSMIKIKPVIQNNLIKESFMRRKQSQTNCMILKETRKSTYKTESYKSILIAKPDHVCFHNFQRYSLYRKKVILTNNSNYLTRFQIKPTTCNSKFRVEVENKKLKSNFIAPGMQVKLIISFYTEDFCEKEETINVYVQHGRPINIKLQCTRNPPILKKINIPHLQHAESQIQDLYFTRSIETSRDSWESYTTQYSSTINEFDKYYYSERLLTNIDYSSMIFDCGKCFVGEQIAFQIRFRNTGIDGKFIVISEIDWYSMFIEDITDINTLILQYFAVWPAYFLLKTQEDVFVHIYFCPSSYGVHVETLYIISDNYSIKSIELIGDGIIYEPQTLQINSQSKETHLFLKKIDTQSIAHYHLNLQTNLSNEFEVISKKISITNTSQMYVFFRWDKYARVNKKENEIENEHLINDFYIIPESGIILASTVIHFNIIITIPSTNLIHDQVYGLLRLYIEDIPEAAILKNHELCTMKSLRKRRVCTNSVDILVADIKLIQTLHYDTPFEKKSWILDEYENDQKCITMPE